MTLSRKNKSSRNAPSATRFFRSRLVGDDAHIGRAGDVLAEALVFALLQEPQQLRLDFHGQVADFVEEQRAAFGRLDLAPMILDGAGEGAADVSEQFAFQQFAGEAGAADGDKRLVRQMAAVADDAGGDAFARAAFAEDKDGGGGFGGPHEHVHDFVHGRGGEVEDGFEGLGPGFGDLLLEAFDPLVHFAQPLQAGEHGEELLALKRFLEEIDGAAAHGFHGGFDAALGGEHDHGDL